MPLDSDLTKWNKENFPLEPSPLQPMRPPPSAFSFQAENGYTVQRFTKEHRIIYFVQPDFLSKHGDRVYNVEVQVENEYVKRQRLSRYGKKNNCETTLCRPKTFGNSTLWAQGQRMEMPNYRRF